MTTTFTRYLYAALIVTVALFSCSRPVAYFLPEPVNLAIPVHTQPVAMPTLNQAPVPPVRPIMNTITTTSPLEVYVRNDKKPALSKPLRQRMDRVETLLVLTHETSGLSGSSATRKINRVERLMVKNMNQTNSQQLAPSKLKKAMGDRIKLFGGILLLVIGVVIMVAGPNPILFLGIILALAGVVGVIAGLFGE